jgi:hypothetical protein
MLSLETTAHIPYDDPRFQEAYGIAWSGTDDGPLLRYFAEDGEYTDIASEWTWSGTASGELRLDGRTYPATNRPYSVQGVALCNVDEAGAITAHRDFYDMRALLKQLGLV